MPPYYADIGNGESYVDGTLHADPDCTDEFTTPINSEDIDDEAATFCEDCGPLGHDSDGDGDGSPDADTAPALSEQIDDGVCPWCDEYEGDHVGQHASSAHADEWDEYKN